MSRWQSRSSIEPRLGPSRWRCRRAPLFAIGVLAFLILLQPIALLAQSKPRIVGGDLAPEGAYPWMAALVRKDLDPTEGHYSGGVLVAPQWVLTAAHSVAGRSRNEIEIWFGIHDLRETRNATKRKIARIFTHPGYRTEGPGILVSDLALILLDRPVGGVDPIELASTRSHNRIGELVRALGWGVVDPDLFVLPFRLRQVDLQIADLDDAQEHYGDLLGPTHLAAAFKGRDTCLGDSGGPLFRIIGGDPVLVGITSFGDGCALRGVEGIYTDVLEMRPWIDGWLRLTEKPPEMRLRYGRRTISPGDPRPSRAEGTHFGKVRTKGRGRRKTYTLRNKGAGLLVVPEASASNRIFKVSGGQPKLVFPGRVSSLRVTFKPRRRGMVRAKIRIDCNDPDDLLFRFLVRGKGR